MKTLLYRMILGFLLVSPCQAEEPTFVKFSSQANDWFEKFEFRARQVEKPDQVRKVFVIVSTDLRTLEKELCDPKWDRILAQKDVGLVSVGYKYQKKLAQGADPKSRPLYKLDPAKASALLKEVLSAQIDSYFPRALSFGYLAKEDAGKEAVSLVTLNPKKTLFWIIEDFQWFVPEELRDLPVGMAISRHPSEAKNMLEAHLGNNKKSRQITFVRDPAKNRDAVDQFTIDFIACVGESKSKIQSSITMDLLTEVALSKSVKEKTLGYTSWLPNIDLSNAWKNIHSLKEDAKVPEIFEEKVDTGINEQPFLSLYTKLPTEMDGESRPKGVLCIATWHAAEHSLTDILIHGKIRKDLVDWANTNQMAVVTWNTATLWKSGTSQVDLEKDEARSQDKSFDAMAVAWEKGMRRLAAKFHLPETGYYLYGVSRGAHWGHRLVLRMPQRFAAAHIHVANSYDIPNVASKNVLWLVTSGELDAGYQASMKFYQSCKQLGYPIMIKAGENLGHEESKKTNALGKRFFEYAKMLSDKNSTRDVVGPALSLKMADAMRQDLKDTKFFGDFINQGVYPIDQGSWVPVAQRVPLVTKEIADVWGQLNNQ